MLIGVLVALLSAFLMLFLLAPALSIVCTVGAAWLLGFRTALHELTVSALLAAPRVTTLGVAVLHLEQEGDIGATAALATLLVLLVGAAAGLLLLGVRQRAASRQDRSVEPARLRTPTGAAAADGKGS
jgi:hypothetical protein